MAIKPVAKPAAIPPVEDLKAEYFSLILRLLYRLYFSMALLSNVKLTIIFILKQFNFSHKMSQSQRIPHYGLEKCTLHELWSMAKEMDLPIRRKKADMVSEISRAFEEYEDYLKRKVQKYTRIKQLGNKGKEGITYLVVSEENKQKYAMKTFRKTKSSATLKKEYKLQKIASRAGVAPRVYEYDTISKYIVMDVMDKHLIDVMDKQKGHLHKYQQQRIIDIFKTLDKCGVFHGDANLANYMVKDKIIYMIDFGFSKNIDKRLERKLGTHEPNFKIDASRFYFEAQGSQMSNFCVSVASPTCPRIGS